MVSVRKTNQNRTRSGNGRSSIGFIVNPDNEAPEGVRVELVSHDPEESVIRMIDETGNLILQEDGGFGDESDRLEFTVNNLEAGTYFFEVNDGFFCQVKEVRIPPD